MYFTHRQSPFVLIPALAAAIAALMSAGCATARLASGWPAAPVAADGRVEDWRGPQLCSVMEGGLQLSVANDAERLFVLAKFRANDPRWSRAAGAGMSVRVTNSRRRTFSFRLADGPERAFPGRPDESAPGPGRMPDRAGPTRGELKGKLVVIDADKVEIPVPADGTLGPAAAFAGDNAVCIYEFSIPLADSEFGHYSVDARPGADLSITVSAGLSEDERRAMREQVGARGPRGDGEMPPGGGPGGPPGGGSGGPGGQGGPGRGGARGAPSGRPAVENPVVSVKVRLATGP